MYMSRASLLIESTDSVIEGSELETLSLYALIFYPTLLDYLIDYVHVGAHAQGFSAYVFFPGFCILDKS